MKHRIHRTKFGTKSGAKFALIGAVAALGLAISSPAQSVELTVGLGESPQTMDPHWTTGPSSFNINSQVYENLFRWDKDAKSKPHLAESYEIVNDTTWRIKLRKDVKFHDGAPFTADDVVFSLKRGMTLNASANNFRTYLRQIKETRAIDPHTVEIITGEPFPDLVASLTYFLIVSKKSEAATTEDYNAGKYVIGTGPFKFVSFSLNDRTVIEKNPDYWGKKAHWDKITYRSLPNEPARAAALLAGDVDIIEHAPTGDVDQLTKAGIVVSKYLTGRVTYVSMDATPRALESGKITGPNGEKLDKNPLSDKRVREALAEAIDNEAFVKRLYFGEAEPAAQYLLEGAVGYVPEIKLKKGDPARARKLLEESGWLGKFKIELSTAANYFPKSQQTAEGVAQFWTRVGVPTTVTTQPFATWIAGLRDRKIPIVIGGYQNTRKDASGFYPTLSHTRDDARFYGTLNYLGYSNPEADKLIEQASATMDDKKRGELWTDVSRLVVADKNSIPLFFLYVLHASKPTIGIEMRADRAIMGENVFLKAAAPAAKK